MQTQTQNLCLQILILFIDLQTRLLKLDCREKIPKSLLFLFHSPQSFVQRQECSEDVGFTC